MWRHQRKGTLLRKKYHARRLIRAYDICRLWALKETFSRSLCSFDKKYYRKSVETADLGRHCFFRNKAPFRWWRHIFICRNRDGISIGIDLHVDTDIIRHFIRILVLCIHVWHSSRANMQMVKSYSRLDIYQHNPVMWPFAKVCGGILPKQLNSIFQYRSSIIKSIIPST